MSNEDAIIKMIRILPMVEALNNQSTQAVASGIGIESGDYALKRINAHIRKVMDITEDELLDGMEAIPNDSDSDDQKMQLVTLASAELSAYLRQRIGISMETGSGLNIGALNLHK